MSDAIRAILDAVTDRVLAYRPKDKGEWAKRTERHVRLYREEPHPKDPSRTYYSLDEYVEFDPEDIVAFDANTKRVTFRCENANGKVITVVLEKKMLLSKNVMTFAD